MYGYRRASSKLLVMKLEERHMAIIRQFKGRFSGACIGGAYSGLAVLGVMFLLCLSLSSRAQVLKVVTEHAPPLQASIDGNQTGCALRRVKSLAREANIEIEIEFLPWARALNMALNRSNTLIFSIQRTKAREARLLWLAKVASIDVGLHRHVSRRDMSVEDLTLGKYTLSLPRDDAFGEHIDKKSLIPYENLLFTGSYEESVDLLYKGKIDLLIGNLFIWRTLAEQQGRSGDEIVAFYPLPELNQVLYLAANLKLAPELVARFRQSTQKLAPTFVREPCP